MDKATSFIFCPSLGHCRSYEIRNCSKSLFVLGMQFYVTARLDNCIAFMVKFYDLGWQFYVTECASTIIFCLNLDNLATDASIQCIISHKIAFVKLVKLTDSCNLPYWSFLQHLFVSIVFTRSSHSHHVNFINERPKPRTFL